MYLSLRELWTVIHGMVLGAVFLLAFAGGLAGLWSLRPEWVTVAGIRERLVRLIAGTWIMAVAAWATVVTGTYVVYTWFRATPPTGADLTAFPRSFLLADPTRSGWHTFGMEWKEHIAWLAPILSTAVAYVVIRYGARLAVVSLLAVGAAILGARNLSREVGCPSCPTSRPTSPPCTSV